MCGRKSLAGGGTDLRCPSVVSEYACVSHHILDMPLIRVYVSVATVYRSHEEGRGRKVRVGLISVRKQPAFSADIGSLGDHRERRQRETPSKRLNGHDEQSEPAADRVLPSLYLLIGASLGVAVRVELLLRSPYRHCSRGCSCVMKI